MEKLLRQVKQLELYIPEYAAHQPAVSAGNVGWHIQHTLMVFNIVITEIEKSDPTLFKRKFNKRKLLIFLLNKIPRGRVKAPKIVEPTGENIPETLVLPMERVIAKINSLSHLQKNNHFPHPFLGNLNLKETIKFLRIHTNHHLKIIEDILKVKNG